MRGIPGFLQSRSKCAIAWLGGLAVISLATAASADDAASFLQSARQLERTHDLRGAEIQLRNAAQAAPANGDIRLELAKVYLQLHNANAAEAELFAAHMRGVKDDATAAPMAQAMLELGEFGDLLKNVLPGNRPPKIESLVRTYRGIAETALNETDRAREMFADAERLDPKSVLPLVGEIRFLLAQNQLDAAWQKSEQALKLDPKNGDILDARGLIFELRGQPDAALQQFAAALAIDPANLRARLDRANLQIGHNKLDDAEKDLAEINKAAPNSMIAIYLQMLIDTQRGNFKAADQLLSRLRGAIGEFPHAYLVAAEIKLQLNQLDQAQAFASKFVAQAPDKPVGYQMLGAIAMKRGDLDGGITNLEKAVKLAPNDGKSLTALGQAYLAHGDMDKARDVFNQAALKTPGNTALATQRAEADFVRGDREASVTALSDIFKGGKGSLPAGPPLVIEALQLGQLDVAEAAALELLQREPNNPTSQELLAAVRMAQHDYSGAEVLLRSLLAKQPNLASARHDLADVYLSTNRASLAKALYQERLKANPRDGASLEALADIALQSRDDAGAIKLFEQAQNAAPADPRPSLRILGILELRKKWPEAIARARALQAKYGKEAGVADALGQLYFASGDHAAAIAAYKETTTKFPAYAPAFAHFAGVLAADKKYDDAITVAGRAMHLDPGSPDLKRAWLTLTYLAKGTDATLAASQTVTGDKSGEAAVMMTAAVLAANGNRPGAIALLEKRQAQNPSGAVVVRLALLYQADNRLDRSLGLLGSWTAAHPTDVDARFALAQVDSVAGRLDKALAEYEWLVTQRPDNPVILNNLAYLYDSKHDPRARATAEKAIKLAPGSPSVADTLGWIMAEQGDSASAAKYLTQASSAQPNDATIQYHYAVMLSKTGKAEQARDVLQRLLKLNVQPDTKTQAQLLLAKLGGGR